jgi:hypothetical protein
VCIYNRIIRVFGENKHKKSLEKFGLSYGVILLMILLVLGIILLIKLYQEAKCKIHSTCKLNISSW